MYYTFSLTRLVLMYIGDGFRHFGYQKHGKFYNGVTMDNIHGPNKSNVNGISGTIIGFLIDKAEY
jgi:hypothetical protein